MPENLRILNDEGRRRWRQWIEDLRLAPSLPVPSDLLTNPETSLSPPTAVPLPAGPFGTKFEMAKQLLPAVIALETSRLPDASWPGVWDALALAYFEEICPSLEGKRRVKELESYVWSPLYTRSYKHRVAGTISLYRAYGRASILCLWGEVPILSDYEIQLSSHPSWLGAKAVGEVLYQMYWEHDSGRPKRGGMSRVRPGALFHKSGKPLGKNLRHPGLEGRSIERVAAPGLSSLVFKPILKSFFRKGHGNFSAGS